MEYPYSFRGIGAVWKALWVEMITNLRGVHNDAQSGAVRDNHFIGRAGIMAQVAAWILHDDIEAFDSMWLQLFHIVFVINEAGDGQVQHNPMSMFL